jgi:hypothetical protein
VDFTDPMSVSGSADDRSSADPECGYLELRESNQRDRVKGAEWRVSNAIERKK